MYRLIVSSIMLVAFMFSSPALMAEEEKTTQIQTPKPQKKQSSVLLSVKKEVETEETTLGLITTDPNIFLGINTMFVPYEDDVPHIETLEIGVRLPFGGVLDIKPHLFGGAWMPKGDMSVRLWTFGLGADIAWRANTWFAIQGGMDAVLTNGRYAQDEQQILEGHLKTDLVFLPSDLLELNLGLNLVVLGNGYRNQEVEDSRTPGPWIRLGLKLHFDPFSKWGSEDD